ncbi:hypothetical protein QSJ19_15970 [Gordonia sp. ABSL11-1]|uniref:hypothetical protein n=1 Tax=Gordonia sp. ABSL11-1 TaxID=3053924 RepID=UPI00257409FD|nr:hypothetical protein [Gordonia sp. ABSL11-1]MDL9947059.1 hypothetical protein [Gordonia sp. ABSL11-1]
MDGALSDRVLASFPKLVALHDDRRTTTELSGELPDTAAARGVIARLDSLGLTLLEFRRNP